MSEHFVEGNPAALHLGDDRLGGGDSDERFRVALVAHELRHVEQYRKYGHVGFLVRYFMDLPRNRGKYSRDLPLEAECYELQSRVQQALPQQYV